MEGEDCPLAAVSLTLALEEELKDVDVGLVVVEGRVILRAGVDFMLDSRGRKGGQTSLKYLAGRRSV